MLRLVYVSERARGVLPQLQDGRKLPPSIAVVPAGQMPSPEMGGNPTDERSVSSSAPLLCHLDRRRRPAQAIFKKGETEMGDKGKKDKGKREPQKKAQLGLKEKRKLKREKKNRY